jgi:excisionase family DNA binding protein
MKSPNTPLDIYEQIVRMNKLLELIYKQVGQEYRSQTDTNGYFTTSEVMKYLSVSENTITKMRRTGKIQFIEISNGSYRYPKKQFTQAKQAA